MCIKRCLDVTQLRADPDTREPVTTDVPFKISDFDKNALEEAVRLKEGHGGKVTVITVGTPDSRGIMKEALASGADEGVVISDEAFSEIDSLWTATILSAALRHISKWDLIICGEGSIDEYGMQVGPRLAETLGIPQLTFVRKLTYSTEKIIVERDSEGRVEVLEARLPALITVGLEINEPRYPTLIQLMQASKKPIREFGANDLGLEHEKLNYQASGFKTLQLKAPSAERRKIRMDGDYEEEARKLVKTLIELGVVGKR